MIENCIICNRYLSIDTTQSSSIQIWCTNNNCIFDGFFKFCLSFPKEINFFESIIQSKNFYILQIFITPMNLLFRSTLSIDNNSNEIILINRKSRHKFTNINFQFDINNLVHDAEKLSKKLLLLKEFL